MPSPFLFLRLPILCQLLILKNSSLLELFFFSLISQRSKQIVKSLDLTLSKMEWGYYSFNSSYELKLTDSHGHVLCLENYFLEDRIDFYLFVPFGELNFNGKRLTVFLKDYDTYIGLAIENEKTTENESLKLMDQLTEHFLELFTITKYEVALHHSPDICNYFVWKYTKFVNSVKMLQYVPGEVMTAEQVKFIMEEITTDYLEFETSVEDGFEYSGSLKMKRLDIKGQWLALEAVLNMDCEEVTLCRSKFTYKDIYAIVKKWLDGGLINLKKFEETTFHPISEHSEDTVLDHVLEGIETFLWNVKNRPRSERFQKGRDIRRSDGTIATVYYESKMFEFNIWSSESFSDSTYL